jgi:hypothetical protein
MDTDLFLSHSSDDAEVARELRGILEAAGYTCWMAPDDVVGPDPWARQILNAIRASRATLVLISANSNGSPHVAREVSLASGGTKAILPIRIERVALDGELEYHLAGLQHIDAYPPPLSDHGPRIIRRLAAIVPVPAGRSPTESGTRSGSASAVVPSVVPGPPVARPVTPPDFVSKERPWPLERPSTAFGDRAKSMLAASGVTVAALVIVAAGVLATGGPGASPSPGPVATEVADATTSSTPTPAISSPASSFASSPAPSTTQSSASPTQDIGDGVFRVGIDVMPATYRTRQPADYCVWERLAGFGGSDDEIIAIQILQNQAYGVVTIRATDVGFESSGCGRWAVDLSQVTASMDSIDHDGTYIVGTDITPGSWRSTGGENCYWVRLRAFDGAPGAVIENDFTDGPSEPISLSIRSTDAGFHTENCGTWRRQ